MFTTNTHRSEANPQSFNRYAYVQNDPVNFVDPSGLDRECVTLEDGEVFCWDTDDDIDGGTAWGARWDPMQPLYDLWLGSQRWDLAMPVMPHIETVNIESSPAIPLRPDISDRDTFAVNSALGACGAAASIAEYSTVNGSRTHWRGSNGKWNRMGWGGNGATGARSAAVGRASAAGLLGRATGGVGVVFSGYQGAEALRQGNTADAAKSGVDVGVGLVGIFGGPPGAAIGGGYFVVDTTIGWGEVGKAARTPRPAGCGWAGAKVGGP